MNPPRAIATFAACGLAWLSLFICATALLAADPFAPQSFAYVLQAEGLAKKRPDAVAKLAACDRDLIVIDYAFGGDPEGPWSPAEIQSLRAGKTGRKVVAYISVGEAEDYRPYWNKSWDANHDGKPDPGSPAWLEPVNPQWKGNYRVRYWDPAWQKIILAYLDQILAQGFDGVYLDIIDGFETFEFDPATKDWIADRPNPNTGRSYRKDMIAWVKTIAAFTRNKKPGFLVIPQNGSQLLADASFVQIISAIGLEDLLTEGNKKQPAEHCKQILQSLSALNKAGKPALLIEYGKTEKARLVSIENARQHSLILLLVDRQLKTLGDCPKLQLETRN